MKRTSNILILFLIVLGVTSCYKEDKFTSSIIDTSTPELNATDQWIRENYTNPYNIEVLYKWNDSEANSGKTLIPPQEQFVIPLMKMIDSVWIAPYIKVAGIQLFKQLCPKQFLLIGSPSYNSDGSRTQGTAEAGRKIVLYSVNWYNPKDSALLWEEYIHVIYHEFGHIMNQTVGYNPDFKKITAGKYTAAWTDFSDNTAQVERGFISAYAMSSPDEDFVETMSIYITTKPAVFNALLDNIKAQNQSSYDKIMEKIAMVREYLKSVWLIDMDKLRTEENAAFDKVVKGS